MSLFQKIKCALGMHPGFRDLEVKPARIYAKCRCCKRVTVTFTG